MTNDRTRLQQLCAAIACLAPESNSCGLSLRSLDALQRLVQSRLDASNADEPKEVKDLRQAIAAPTTATIAHTAEQIAAFKHGLQDRLDGKPITAFGDARDDDDDLNDAYCCGYDPHDELQLTVREFIDYNKQQIAQYLSETGIVLPADLPRTSCEFTVAKDYDPTNDLLLLRLLNSISETKPGFDEALEAIRKALPVPMPKGLPVPLDPLARSAIELLISIRDGQFMSNDLGESNAIIKKIDDFDKVLKNALI